MYTINAYAVIGHPIAHSLSPQIHAAFARQTGERMDYIAIDAPLNGFAETVKRFQLDGGKGANVTLPFKGEAFALSQTHSHEAKIAQAVNVMVFAGDGGVFGANTDGIGLVRDIKANRKGRISGQNILILGAGGAARGIIGPILAEHPKCLVIANRDINKADALAEAMRPHGSIDICSYPGLAQRPLFDLIINATSASLANTLPPLPAGILARKGWCYDLAYGEKETIFQRWGIEQGASKSMDGKGMLVEQAAESFLLWRGKRPETSSILARLGHTP